MAMVTQLNSQQSLRKLGRNDLCSCGSSRKYKKCCLNVATIACDEDYQVPDSFKQKVKEHHAGRDVTFSRPEDLGVVKMSGVILEYAGELLELATTFAERKRMVEFHIIAWNLAVTHPEHDDGLEEKIHSMLCDFGFKENSDDFDETANFFMALIHVKHALYPNINRVITDCEITPNKDGIYLNVASVEHQATKPKHGRLKKRVQ